MAVFIQSGRKEQRGVTYLALLFAIAIAGIALATLGESWGQSSRREKELELLFIGGQYRRAITLYYEHSPGGAKSYPRKLDDLLADTRFNPPQHYLRKIYRDPMTNQLQWGFEPSLVGGGIMGVYSLSDVRPLKQSGFGYLDRTFEGAAHYSDWKFTYLPPGLRHQ